MFSPFLLVLVSEFKLKVAIVFSSEKVSFPRFFSCLGRHLNSTLHIRGPDLLNNFIQTAVFQQTRQTYPWNLKRYFLSGKYWVSTTSKPCSNKPINGLLNVGNFSSKINCTKLSRARKSDLCLLRTLHYFRGSYINLLTCSSSEKTVSPST